MGSHSRSAPTAATSPSIFWMVEAMVNSRRGSPTAPPAMRRPSAPVEKSPETGFTPECRPETDCTRMPSPTWAMRASWLSSPGSRETAWQPAPGVLLKPPRMAEPVDAVPERRPV